jgi:CBS domain-containing protein
MEAAHLTARGLTAADVMTPAPRTCSVFSTVLEASLIFRDAGCGAVPVVDAGVPVGILTDRDVALALAENPDLASLPVGDVMTRGVVSVAPGDSLASVAARFEAEGLHRLLVVDGDNALCGIIAWPDLAPHLPGDRVGRFAPGAVEQPQGPPPYQKLA